MTVLLRLHMLLLALHGSLPASSTYSLTMTTPPPNHEVIPPQYVTTGYKQKVHLLWMKTLMLATTQAVMAAMVGIVVRHPLRLLDRPPGPRVWTNW
jgi:hypothetical protein